MRTLEVAQNSSLFYALRSLRAVYERDMSIVDFGCYSYDRERVTCWCERGWGEKVMEGLSLIHI